MSDRDTRIQAYINDEDDVTKHESAIIALELIKAKCIGGSDFDLSKAINELPQMSEMIRKCLNEK
ncbi:hypothetical protein [Teredinibacter sp. KSP-S5-2]|uniref:hypothetical protein n=1 Tax=Teredinibacter sp. KSP-S5-2 TaxID=3034506 RepID=UPI0029341C63|nr:hypothetical protein [Teredinibacter sp. KSP-S5-2]WNO11468.1 hypothetical protein P5V12_09820 [Teredinibacter sp. KSP-S5-2]